ncbi:NADP-dependent alkenal double bond reductase P2-like isoform X2 [Magnolia sinica]|uniref:NADP-dependent alkenal double bond reductase P2-like isoform X2 n=1 Tax=Magnolia sinica TaxID=86752 RepID=UPI00265A6EBE|nr:NADP-dependent alkenal double bond reductase P2-like isoform X2 [Magnolia sinica]
MTLTLVFIFSIVALHPAVGLLKSKFGFDDAFNYKEEPNLTVALKRDCTKLLVNFHSSAADSKLKAVHRKYSNPLRGAVALLPPSSKFLKESKDAAST